MITIAVTTFKGGVGKTTTAFNLACALVARDNRVLAVDLDRTQQDLISFDDNIPRLEFRATTAGRVARLVQTAQSRGFDALVMDCPPALEKEPAAALRVADVAIVPVVPELLAARGLMRFMDVVRQVKNPRNEGSNPRLQVKILLTMCDARDKQSQPLIDELRARFGAQVFEYSIARQAIVNEANNQGRSLIDCAPKSQAARVYQALAQNILEESKGK